MFARLLEWDRPRPRKTSPIGRRRPVFPHYFIYYDWLLIVESWVCRKFDQTFRCPFGPVLFFQGPKRVLGSVSSLKHAASINQRGDKWASLNSSRSAWKSKKKFNVELTGRWMSERGWRGCEHPTSVNEHRLRCKSCSSTKLHVYIVWRLQSDFAFVDADCSVFFF